MYNVTHTTTPAAQWAAAPPLTQPASNWSPAGGLHHMAAAMQLSVQLLVRAAAHLGHIGVAQRL